MMPVIMTSDQIIRLSSDNKISM